MLKQRPFLADFLIALGVHVAFLLWCFRNTLWNGHVTGWGTWLPAAECILNPIEFLTQLMPVLYASAKTVKAGLFPAWLPESQAGTPLLGKMVNGIFSPYQLIYYLLPLKSFGLGLMLASAVKATFSFVFTYFFARLLKIGLWGSILAGIVYLYCPNQIYTQGLFSTFGTGTYLPLVLCVMEMHVRGFKKPALFLLPWAVALPFFAGHFEGAVRIQVVGAAFLLTRLFFLRKTRPLEPGALLALGAAGFAGMLIALPQILAGAEYVSLSYNQIWRSLPSYGWSYYTITKYFAGEDALALAAAAALFGAFLHFFYKGAALERETSAKAILTGCAAAVLLAAAIATLQRVGLDGLIPRMLNYSRTWKEWILEPLLVMCSLTAFASVSKNSAVKALGVVLFLSMAVWLKMPPLSNIVSSLPVFSNFHNATYNFEYFFALAVLTGFAVNHWLTPTEKSLKERGRDALRRSLAVLIVFGGVALSVPLQTVAARMVPTGVSTNISRSPESFGITGPEQFRFVGEKYTVSGYVPAYPTPQSVELSVVDARQRPLTSSPAKLEPGAGRHRFWGRLNVPVGTGRVLATVDYGSNKKQTVLGPSIEHFEHPPFYWILLALILTMALVSMHRVAAMGLIAILFAHYLVLMPLWSSVPRAEIPLQLPGLDKLKDDKTLFRVTTPTMGNFLRADYLNLYDLSDIRGGDNVDLLPMTVLSFLCIELYQSGKADDFELELKILGLMNVKYLVFPTGTRPVHPSLEPVHDGADLSIYRNRHARPRALFFEEAQVLSLPNDVRQWGALGDVLSKLNSMIRAPFSIERTLLLNDAPRRNAPAAAGAAAGKNNVTVEAYGPTSVRLRVETDRSGFVFLSDSYFPGWVARVNGATKPILRSWMSFRSVQVDAGVSTVEFVYRPMKLWFAVAVSGLMCLGWLAAYIFAWRRNLFKPLEPPPAPKKKSSKEPPSAYPEMESAQAPVHGVHAALLTQVGCGLSFWILWTLVRLVN